MLGYGWQRLHDERRPQRVVKITSRSTSSTTASASSPRAGSWRNCTARGRSSPLLFTNCLERLSGKYQNWSEGAFLGGAQRRKLHHFAP